MTCAESESGLRSYGLGRQRHCAPFEIRRVGPTDGRPSRDRSQASRGCRGVGESDEARVVMSAAKVGRILVNDAKPIDFLYDIL